MVDEDCTDALVPFCDVDSGECVSCDQTAEPDMSCTTLDPMTPVCEGTTCVQCTADNDAACVETTPICDVDTNMCVGCSEHAQCPESACNLAAGNCIDPSMVRYVNGGTVDCDDGGDGSQATPYCTLSQALVDSPDESVIFVTGLDGGASYQAAHVVANTTAIFGVPNGQQELPTLQGFNMAPALTVSPSGDLFMRNMVISGTLNTQPGILVNSGGAWVEQSRIVNNTGGGIVVDGGGTLVIENSFVGGGNVTGVRAVDVVNGTVDVTYSTLGAGFGSGAAGLLCADGTGSSIRNSIVLTYGGDPELVCDNAAMSGNITEMDVPAFDDQSGWFLDFSNGDFHLVPGMYPAAIDTAAQWQTGDPTTDIDGDARPTRDGTPDSAGADLIP